MDQLNIFAALAMLITEKVRDVMFGKEDLTRTSMKDLVIITVVIAALSILSNAIVVFALNPIQALVFPEVSQFASLLFLTHGVKVLSTALLRAYALPGLFVGALVSAYFVWGLREPELVLLLSIVGGGVPWVVFECLRAIRFNAYYLHADGRMPSFHTVLLAGIFCSIANGFFSSAILETSGSIHHVTLMMAAYIIGDTIGLIVSWLIANNFVRTFRIGMH